MLLLSMLLYTVASLAHFIHNAVYIAAYPNLPAWMTPFGIYASWCSIAAVGAVGYWLFRRGSRTAGLVAIAVYAVFGYAGLDHYVVAPMSAHTWVMNASILVEVAFASLLLLIAGAEFWRGLSVKR
jgi:hypothetical protein